VRAPPIVEAWLQDCLATDQVAVIVIDGSPTLLFVVWRDIPLRKPLRHLMRSRSFRIVIEDRNVIAGETLDATWAEVPMRRAADVSAQIYDLARDVVRESVA
jgi:hypothetical protein